MTDDKYVLLECVRTVFPHLKAFSDEMIERKINSKKLDDCVSEFVLYLQVDGIKTRNEKLVTGVKLLKLVQHQMLNYQYPSAAVTPKNVVESLSLLDDYFYRTAERKKQAHDEAFPGYAQLIA